MAWPHLPPEFPTSLMFHLRNTTKEPRIFSLSNDAGEPLIDDVLVLPKETSYVFVACPLMGGLRWSASGEGLRGTVSVDGGMFKPPRRRLEHPRRRPSRSRRA